MAKKLKKEKYVVTSHINNHIYVFDKEEEAKQFIESFEDKKPFFQLQIDRSGELTNIQEVN